MIFWFAGGGKLILKLLSSDSALRSRPRAPPCSSSRYALRLLLSFTVGFGSACAKQSADEPERVPTPPLAPPPSVGNSAPDGSSPILGLSSGFVVGRHGFSFANFRTEYPKAVLTGDLLQRMFGASNVCTGPTAPCTLTPGSATWLNSVNMAMQSGHCEGMAVLSQLMFLGRIDPKSFGAESANALQIDGNDALQQEIAFWSATQLNPLSIEPITTKLTAAEAITFFTEHMKPGSGDYYRLGLAQAVDGHLVAPHGVTPISLEATSNGGAHNLHVYDSQFPGVERIVTLDLAKNRWEYAGVDPQGAPRIYVGDSANGNRMVVAPVIARQAVLPCPFCKTSNQGMAIATGGWRVDATINGVPQEPVPVFVESSEVGTSHYISYPILADVSFTMTSSTSTTNGTNPSRATLSIVDKDGAATVSSEPGDLNIRAQGSTSVQMAPARLDEPRGSVEITIKTAGQAGDVVENKVTIPPSASVAQVDVRPDGKVSVTGQTVSGDSIVATVTQTTNVGGENRTSTSEVTTDGSRTVVPTCTVTAPENGTVNGGAAATLVLGGSGTYACSDGFVVSGTAPLCGVAGRLTGDEPTCITPTPSYCSPTNVLLLADTRNDAALAQSLARLGYSVTLASPATYAGTPDSALFAAVVLIADVPTASYTPTDMADAGQASIANAVNRGSGLVTTDWLIASESSGAFASLQQFLLMTGAQTPACAALNFDHVGSNSSLWNRQGSFNTGSTKICSSFPASLQNDGTAEATIQTRDAAHSGYGVAYRNSTGPGGRLVTVAHAGSSNPTGTVSGVWSNSNLATQMANSISWVLQCPGVAGDQVASNYTSSVPFSSRKLVLNRVYLNQAGVVVQLGMIAATPWEDAGVLMALYADDAGVPDLSALLAYSSVVNVPATPVGDLRFDVVEPYTLVAGYYWVGAMTNDATPGNTNVRLRTLSDAKYANYSGVSFSAPPNTARASASGVPVSNAAVAEYLVTGPVSCGSGECPVGGAGADNCASTNTNTDESNCGTCGTICGEPDAGYAICSSGVCRNPDCTVCSSTQYQITACTAFTDTVCGACDSSCATCTGPTIDECASCPDGYTLQ